MYVSLFIFTGNDWVALGCISTENIIQKQQEQ